MSQANKQVSVIDRARKRPAPADYTDEVTASVISNLEKMVRDQLPKGYKLKMLDGPAW